jgi:DNA-binding transcriptional ArsR family regulator
MRLRIIARLCAEGPLSITKLSDNAAVTRQAVTKHLHALADAGLLRDTRVGRERVWAFEPRRLDQVRHCLDQISEQWDAAIERLKAHVEREP